jgi:NAD(P)-dependent dehydrogenase (short-subunit alcohol dehydrogenase family)
MPQHGQDGHGITTQANPAMPPRIGQPLVKYSVVDARSTIGAQREAILARGARLPVGRIGRPEEVAAAVIFLMNNGFVTGTVLPIDGGGRLV